MEKMLSIRLLCLTASPDAGGPRPVLGTKPSAARRIKNELIIFAPRTKCRSVSIFGCCLIPPNKHQTLGQNEI